MRLLCQLQNLLNLTLSFDWLGPLALRIYLAPIFIYAGMNKLSQVDNIAMYFKFLGIPAPELMVYVAGTTELVGGILLIVGLGVRWVAGPLMVTMIVAATTAHWENGWHVLPETELTVPWEWRTDLIEDGVDRKAKAKSLLKKHGNYDYLTAAGPITILKNGIEFAATYFIMLLVLFFAGAGRFFSLDYWIDRKIHSQ
jgi:putative oxidoreductase